MIEIYYENCYIGIPLPDQFLHIYRHIQKELHSQIPKLSLRKPDDAHITLYYIGNAIPETLDEINRKTSRLIQSYLHNTVNISGINYFQKNKPEIIYMDIAASAWLWDLNEKLCGLLDDYNYQERKYNPHLTLGKLRYIESKKYFKEHESEIIRKYSGDQISYKVDEFYIKGIEPGSKKKVMFYQYK